MKITFQACPLTQGVDIGSQHVGVLGASIALRLQELGLSKTGGPKLL